MKNEKRMIIDDVYQFFYIWNIFQEINLILWNIHTHTLYIRLESKIHSYVIE